MGLFIPKEILHTRRWGVWKFEADTNGGKPKKVPYSAITGRRISHSILSSWVSYREALKGFKTGDYDGLGFLLSKNDGLVFIDIDNCIDECGGISAFAQEIISLFPKTYIEYSPSGTGFHLLVKGTIPCNRKNTEKGIELYSDKRYMAFTGNAYTAAEPAFAQDALNEIVRRLFRNASATQLSISKASGNAADADVLVQARRGRNADVFSLLWSGNWEGRYRSQSEADMRLISLLYYYSGDAEQTRRLFSQSGLGQRDKSRFDDYLTRTISKVVESATLIDKHDLSRGTAEPRRKGLTDTPANKPNKR